MQRILKKTISEKIILDREHQKIVTELDGTIDRLEKEHTSLETATGFFWGSSHPEDDQATADFISKAREYIKKGYTIEYDSWW